MMKSQLCLNIIFNVKDKSEKRIIFGFDCVPIVYHLTTYYGRYVPCTFFVFVVSLISLTIQ